jgi:hypothetical protein
MYPRSGFQRGDLAFSFEMALRSIEHGIGTLERATIGDGTSPASSARATRAMPARSTVICADR